MSQDLEKLYQELWEFSGTKLDEGQKPMAIAGVMIAQALSIYKTLLNEEEFNLMMDSISESRDKVKKLSHKEMLH